MISFKTQIVLKESCTNQFETSTSPHTTTTNATGQPPFPLPPGICTFKNCYVQISTLQDPKAIQTPYPNKGFDDQMHSRPHPPPPPPKKKSESFWYTLHCIWRLGEIGVLPKTTINLNLLCFFSVSDSSSSFKM